MKRKPISKRTRFEVFKRDCFKCKYCGARAEDGVILHVDHVLPVVAGGTNNLMNLVTACAGCNLGKNKIPLEDNSTAALARAQAEELQQLREQIKLMARWRKELSDQGDSQVDEICRHWEKLATGWQRNAAGRLEIRRLLKKYSIGEIIEAMEKSTSYFRFDDDGKITHSSVSLASSKLGGILYWSRLETTDPTAVELYRIRRIAKMNCPYSYFPEWKAIALLKEALEAGIQTSDLLDAANEIRSYTSFETHIRELIEGEHE